jgi:hypothetical protein
MRSQKCVLVDIGDDDMTAARRQGGNGVALRLPQLKHKVCRTVEAPLARNSCDGTP